MLWLQAAMSRQRAHIDQAVDHQVTCNLGFRVLGLGCLLGKKQKHDFTQEWRARPFIH